MSNEKQPTRGDKRGPGTHNQGRLGKREPLSEDLIVGKPNPPYDVTGPDAISPLLEQVDFPTTTDDLKARIGHVRVPVDRQNLTTVNALLDEVGPLRFQAPHDVHYALNRLWDKIADREGRGGRHPQGDNLTDRPGND